MNTFQPLSDHSGHTPAPTPNALTAEPQTTAVLIALDATQLRAKRERLQIVPLHKVLADNSCSCGHPLCFHPGKHGAAGSVPEGDSYTTSQVCGRARLQIPCNIGISADGCVVLNVDAAYGGFDTFNAVFPRHCLPEIVGTWMVGTPGGGLHIWFRLPAETKLMSNFIFLGPGLSALSGPCVYGIVPPSIGLNQVLYTWESPPDVGIAPIPDGMIPTIVEADATETRGWHVRMTRDQIAARVHADFCARYFKVDYDAFATTWSAVAKYLEKQRIRPESFIHTIFSSWTPAGLQPEDLLSPEVLTTRHAYVRCYWPKHVDYFISNACTRLDWYMTRLSAKETRLRFAERSVSSWHNISPLLCAIIAFYGFPAGAHANKLKDYAAWALEELDRCDLLGEALKRRYCVHPEELRCRLARFIEVQAS